MLKLILTNILKNHLISNVKADVNAELFKFIKDNKLGVILHTIIAMFAGNLLLISFYELTQSVSIYITSKTIDHTHLVTFSLLLFVSILLMIKIAWYIRHAKKSINQKLAQVEQRGLPFLEILSPIVNELHKERTRYHQK